MSDGSKRPPAGGAARRGHFRGTGQPCLTGIGALASGLVALLLTGAATAQTPAGPSPPPKVAVEENTASPVTQIEPTADPLTPAKSDGPPPAAPGAEQRPAVEAPAAAAAPLDPIIDHARRLVSDFSSRGGVAPDDRKAVAGFYSATRVQPVWISPEGLTPRGTAVIAEIKRAADWGLDPTAFDLSTEPTAGATPEVQAAAEIRISYAVLKYARHARGGRTDPSSVSKMIDMQPRIFEPRSLLDSISVTHDAAAYLQGLHPRHEGFQRLRKALLDVRRGIGQTGPDVATEGAETRSVERAKGDGRRAAKTPPRPAARSKSEIEQRILVNMERWRWMPDDLGSFHVVDNVPEQLTRVVKDGKVVLTEKIVVGKPNTPTPMFSANMQFVIFHPTWGVPEGIKTNELGPMLRRASGGGGWFFGGNDGGASRALARHELRVTRGGREINPDSVDWSAVDIRQFQFTQPASSRNVLGVVKFRFPNRHDVYMHDTPERHLFNAGTRAFSHGCMRVQNPMHLAEVVLAHDKGWSSDKVHSFVGRGATTDITLDKPVPVHVTYFTATVDGQGALRLHGDLYGMDGRVASALAGRTVQLAAAQVEAEEPSEKRQERRRSRATREPGGEPFNPFSGLFAN